MALIDNLVSYYKLDETSGTTATDSHGSNNGTNNGATINQTGKIGKAYSFDGSNDYVITSNDFNANNNDFSVSLWVKFPTTGYRVILGNKQTSSNFFDIYKRSDEKIGVETGDSSSISFAVSSTVSTNTWYHIVFTRSGSDGKIYVNNASTSGTTRTGNLGVRPLYFARSVNTYGNIILDEVGIWSRALSSEEVSELYNSGDGLAYPFVTDTIVNVSAALTLSTDDAEPTININVPIITFEQGLTLQDPTFNIIRGVSGTVGTAEISKHYPIEENRSWETVQYLVPDVDLTIRKNRIGLGNC